MTDTRSSPGTDDDFEALREIEEAWLVSELARAIANLAYPVGCGAAPTDYHLKAAAKALFDRYAKMIEMARNAGSVAQGPIDGVAQRIEQSEPDEGRKDAGSNPAAVVRAQSSKEPTDREALAAKLLGVNPDTLCWSEYGYETQQHYLRMADVAIAACTVPPSPAGEWQPSIPIKPRRPLMQIAAPGNDQLSKLWNAIVESTKGDGFWIGEILLTVLEREVGFNPLALSMSSTHSEGGK